MSQARLGPRQKLARPPAPCSRGERQEPWALPGGGLAGTVLGGEQGSEATDVTPEKAGWEDVRCVLACRVAFDYLRDSFVRAQGKELRPIR